MNCQQRSGEQTRRCKSLTTTGMGEETCFSLAPCPARAAIFFSCVDFSGLSYDLDSISYGYCLPTRPHHAYIRGV